MTMSDNQLGFSLIELTTVMIIASIIFVYVGSQSSGRGLELQATRDDVIGGLFYAQQIAMARESATNPIRFVSDGAGSIDVTENGVSIAGDVYPITLPTGHNLTAATLNYDKLGRTTATALTLSSTSGNVTITVESSGYAH